MDSDIINGLKNFDRVWSRVAGGADMAQQKTENDIKTLRCFIADETRDEEFYLAMARCTGRAASTFRCIAAEERGHRKALQVEYFLLTGDSCIPEPSCPAVCGELDAMRMAYFDELESAERYIAAAESTKSERLRELYLLHASDEKNHAEALRCLIARAIG